MVRAFSTPLVCALLLCFAGANDRTGACGSQNPAAVQLKVGSQAPQLEGKDHHGQSVALVGPNSPVTLIYFYPKDNTPG